MSEQPDTKPTTAERPERASFSVVQDGIIVASGDGPYEQAVAEANHYAMVYAQDGPVEVKIVPRKARKVVP